MDTLSQKALRKHVSNLCSKIGSRMIGTEGDRRSAEYVESCFLEYGLAVTSNWMGCEGWDLQSTSLRVGGKPFPAVGNMYSPSASGRGPLVLVESDLPDARFRELKGKVAGVYGDFNPFPLRLNRCARKAEKAGAAAVVVIDTNHTTSATKLIREAALKRLPVMSVSLETGFRLAKLEGETAQCVVKTRRYESETRDVIGILEGGPREICIEAHRDTAPDTPGADDNGSGTVVLLELARLLGESELRHSLRFVSATGEEFGNVGTPVYVKRFARQLKRIDLMINADCCGGALCPVHVYVRKKDTAGPLVERKIKPYRTLTMVRPDRSYGSQIAEYLAPSVNVVNVICDWTNARIHTARDEASNLSLRKLEEVSHFLRDLIVAYDRL